MKLIALLGLFTACLVGCAGQDAGEPNSGEPSTSSGGALGSGGVVSAVGGSDATGGALASGGAPYASGGEAATGGDASSGGLATGGGTATGGAGSGGLSGGTGGLGSGGLGSGGQPGVGGASSGGSAGYQPCPSSPCKIMPLGDSITWGVGDEGNAGYRGPLFASVVGAGQKITFTGSQSNGPNSVSGQSFPKRNEGHSGWGISRVTPYSGGNAGIATLIPNPGFSAGSGGTPNIILLHIGTNDASSYSAAQMTSDLSGLLDKIITNAPDAYVVVAQIIPLGYGDNAVIKAYNQSLPGLVQQRVNAGKHVALVDMFTGFNAGTMLASDKIHPNTSGYAFMAAHWYSAIETMLPN